MNLSAPLLWIVLPAIAAVILLGVGRWARVAFLLAVSLTLGLAVLAWKLPVGELLELGGRSFSVDTALVFLGRQLELRPEQMPLLALIYLLATFWLGGTYAARAGWLALPTGLAVVAVLTAALAVQPFLYAALLIEVAVLLSVPLLAPPTLPLGRGVMRFITLQSFGMPFILFTGHLLAGIESNPGDSLLTLRVGILMGLGFGFLLAIFPFHSWLPMLGEENHPYLAVLVFIFLPQMVMLFGLGFLENYAWMRGVPVLFTGLRWAALGMIVISGVWAGFQSHLGRILGYAVMLEIGFGIFAIATTADTRQGLLLHFALVPARTVALSIWALALTVLQNRTLTGAERSLSMNALAGLGRRYPLAAAGLVMSMFSLTGLPLLASFPPRFALITSLMPENPLLALVILGSGMGLLISALRALAVLFADVGIEWAIQESRSQRIFLLTGVILLVALGLFAPRLLPWLESLARAFPHLAQ